MGAALRKLMLTIHIIVSVGWVGAVLAYIPLDVTAATSDDAPTLRVAYSAMDTVARWVLVPLALAALATGVWISLGTTWGLFRHYWVIVSLLLTTIAVVVLLVETQVISYYAGVARDASATDADLRALGNTLPHSVGGLAVLLFTLVLNVYKPRGLTRYGWRKQQEGREPQQVPPRE
jgi:uncharacterized membrane protein